QPTSSHLPLPSGRLGGAIRLSCGSPSGPPRLKFCTLTRFRKPSEDLSESSALLSKDGLQKSEPSQETRGVPYSTHNDSADADASKVPQWIAPKPRLLLLPYRPDPFVPCMKYSMFCLNSIFFTLGLALSCVGFWGLAAKQSLVGEQIGNLGTDPMLTFVLVGLLVCALSFSGCVGFIRENTTLLRWFFIGIATLMVAQCVVAIVVLCFQEQIQRSVEKTILVAMSRYQDDSDLKFILDEIQLGLECCGVQSYQDWSVNLYFNCTSPGVNSCGVPFSCCIDPLQNGTVPNFQCGFGAQAMGEGMASSVIYLGGCIPRMVLWIHSRIWDIAALCLLVTVVELVCVVCAQRVMREIQAMKALY
ncbi:tetraspanin-10, partial [Hyperolius riggenbachi]|uniref:tetraspanin-10 n=1 Tax=Hyperolius riggenbachi TaxID=752182 RepID=UPI0035A3CD01